MVFDRRLLNLNILTCIFRKLAYGTFETCEAAAKAAPSPPLIDPAPPGGVFLSLTIHRLSHTLNDPPLSGTGH